MIMPNECSFKTKWTQDSSCIQQIEEKQISTLEKFQNSHLRLSSKPVSCGVTRHPAEDLSTWKVKWGASKDLDAQVDVFVHEKGHCLVVEPTLNPPLWKNMQPSKWGI